MGRGRMRAGTVWALVLGGVVILAAGVIVTVGLLCVDVYSHGDDCGSVLEGIFDSQPIYMFGGQPAHPLPDCPLRLADQTFGALALVLFSTLPVIAALLVALWWGLRRIAGPRHEERSRDNPDGTEDVRDRP